MADGGEGGEDGGEVAGGEYVAVGGHLEGEAGAGGAEEGEGGPGGGLVGWWGEGGGVG